MRLCVIIYIGTQTHKEQMHMGIIYAYVRVSSRTQNEQRQINSIKARYNIDDEHIIVEKASGKNYIGRTEYQKLRSTLEKSDLLVIV